MSVKQKMMSRRARSAIALGAVLAFFAFSAQSCEDAPSADDTARAARAQGVEAIRKNQPVQAMEYSPTLETINGWAKTWGKRGKVSYVYMQRSDGEFAGYYVLNGLPVNYCVGGSPPYDFKDPNDGVQGAQQVPAPGLDGAYYGGCDASRYYGFDAVTGQYIEYTDGYVLTAVLSDSPLPLDKQPTPYGSSIADVKAKKK